MGWSWPCAPSSFFSSSAGALAAAPPLAAPAAAAAPPPEPPEGTDASFADPSAISWMSHASAYFNPRPVPRSNAYLVDILAFKLRNEFVQAFVVSLNADGFEDAFDVGSRGRGVATKAQKQIRRQMLHREDAVYRTAMSWMTSRSECKT